MLVAQLSAGFQSLPPLPTSKSGLSGADSQVGSLCARSRALWVSLVNSPMRPGVSATPQPPQIFSVRGFEALFPHAGALGCTVCLTPQLFLPVYPSPPATSLLRVLSAWLQSPPLLRVCINASFLSPWLSDFHTVRFYGSLVVFCF